MKSIKINYSQFHPDSLMELLKEKYTLPDESKCCFFKSGLNDIYKISSSEEEFYLRISLNGEHNIKEIEEETDFILYLRDCGLDIVEPVPLENNKFVWEIEAAEGVRQAVMFRGNKQNPSANAVGRMKNLGILLAKIHEASKSFKSSSVRPYIDEKMLVNLPVEIVRPYLQHRKEDAAFFDKTASKLWNKAESLLSRVDGAMGFCHGDVQPNNLFFDGDVPYLIDFDCMGFGYFAYDLGVLLANLTFIDENIHKSPLWKAVVEGYGEIRKLSKDEIKAVYIFAALHMLRVLTYHAKLTKQNHGSFYFMTDAHLQVYFGKYKSLAETAREKAKIKI